MKNYSRSHSYCAFGASLPEMQVIAQPLIANDQYLNRHGLERLVIVAVRAPHLADGRVL